MAPGSTEQEPLDVLVVGAGLGGIYGVNCFRDAGLSVLAVDGAPEVGGVWFHNAYPGARVDVESYYYCYLDPEIYQSWRWSERYAPQPELHAYLKHVVDEYGIADQIELNTWVTGARWDPRLRQYAIETSSMGRLYARSIVMATGQLSKARKPAFPGLEAFRGDWVQTSHWPQGGVPTEGRRVAVVGTGSSGVQVSTALAESVEHLYVFQRTPHYSVQAANGPMDEAQYSRFARQGTAFREQVEQHPAGSLVPLPRGPAREFTPAERQELLEARWAYGGICMNMVFTDQGTSRSSNEYVAEFVRQQIRSRVHDQEVSESLVPRYPISTRRLIVDTGYYDIFNQANVELVDTLRDPIAGLDERGIRTASGERYEVDLIVFALGFEAFTGALEQANVTNDRGLGLTSGWTEGPQTYLGLMGRDFPNLFTPTGPGSPSVLANMFLGNMQHMELTRDLLVHMKSRGFGAIRPKKSAQREWTTVVSDAADDLLRRQEDNYMVKVTEAGERVFLPYAGGFHTYLEHVQRELQSGFQGFEFL